jgi:uncharacterized protein
MNRKRELNIENHGYDFADLLEVFDGWFTFARPDTRFDCGEARYNLLAQPRGRIINITFTPRIGKFHLISARPASRAERRASDAARQKEKVILVGRWPARRVHPICAPNIVGRNQTASCEAAKPAA